METINLEPILDGYKNILKALRERIKNPTPEQIEEMDKLEAYIKQQEGA